jgi:exoribonuclease R
MSNIVCKLIVRNRAYNEGDWEVQEASGPSSVPVPSAFHPLNHKLFANDMFFFDAVGFDAVGFDAVGNCVVTLLHSSVRSGALPGVLVLEGNKTYGRAQNGKLLYKCIPDDVRLPVFLVPYEIKKLGFSKVLTNLYVTLVFDHWCGAHPRGKLDCVIGPVDQTSAFYEYQLYCKSLHASIQTFQKEAKKAVETLSHDAIVDTILQKNPSIEDRTSWSTYTIDPRNSVDFDDAFSVRDLGDGRQLLSVYISNVTLWLDALQLWSSFAQRISTIYLPDKKRPMLPTLLSDDLCSLRAKTKRVAFVVDFHIQDGTIQHVGSTNALIQVARNFIYEEPVLLACPDYLRAFALVQSLLPAYPYIPELKDSHDFICYLMVLTNYECATRLLERQTGIFRTTVVTRDVNVPDSLPTEVGKYIKMWNSTYGQYIRGDDQAFQNFRHTLLNVDAYIHITSPIRRLVDLLNMIEFQRAFSMATLSPEAFQFYDKWLNELDYINATMRSIRKVQCDCDLLEKCQTSPDTLEQTYDGYLFDKLRRTDGLFQYVVYLPKLKLVSRITQREEYDNFDLKSFRLFLFQDEARFKRKIRLQLA